MIPKKMEMPILVGSKSNMLLSIGDKNACINQLFEIFVVLPKWDFTPRIKKCSQTEYSHSNQANLRMSVMQSYLKQRPIIYVLGLLVLLGVGGYFVYFQHVQQKTNNAVLTKWTDENMVILLTMTIQTEKTISVARKKVSDRIEDYRKSLTQWAKLPYKVVVVENSGYGNPFQDILKNAPHIQYISVHIPSNPTLGIGYGEAQTLKYAMENVIKNDSIYITKMTGRYAPAKDLSDIIHILISKKPEVLLKEMPSDKIVTQRSEWFVAKRQFYQTVVEDCMQMCDERKGMPGVFETRLHAVGEITKNVVKTNLNIKVLATRTGSFNTPVSWI